MPVDRNAHVITGTQQLDNTVYEASVPQIAECNFCVIRLCDQLQKKAVKNDHILLLLLYLIEHFDSDAISIYFESQITLTQ